MIEECVIVQPRGFGLFHTTCPDLQSSGERGANRRRGKMADRGRSAGHWRHATRHGGPNCRTMSRSNTVAGGRIEAHTSHFWPRATRYLSVMAGTGAREAGVAFHGHRIRRESPDLPAGERETAHGVGGPTGDRSRARRRGRPTRPLRRGLRPSRATTGFAVRFPAICGPRRFREHRCRRSVRRGSAATRGQVGRLSAQRSQCSLQRLGRCGAVVGQLRPIEPGHAASSGATMADMLPKAPTRPRRRGPMPQGSKCRPADSSYVRKQDTRKAGRGKGQHGLFGWAEGRITLLS